MNYMVRNGLCWDRQNLKLEPLFLGLGTQSINFTSSDHARSLPPMIHSAMYIQAAQSLGSCNKCFQRAFSPGHNVFASKAKFADCKIPKHKQRDINITTSGQTHLTNSSAVVIKDHSTNRDPQFPQNLPIMYPTQLG